MKHSHEFSPDTLNIHHLPNGMNDRIALGVVKTMRVFADRFFAKRYGHRAVVLESVAAAAARPRFLGAGLAMLDVEIVRKDFSILSRTVNGRPLVYLDNGASAQKPQVVIHAMSHAYAQEYANVHRGLHYLSNLATDNCEQVRGIVARFLGAASEDEIIFNSGATEGINMVAYGWAMPRMQVGDEVILSIMEHHANIVPWHFLRERQGLVIKWVVVDITGRLDPAKVLEAITPRTKLITVRHCSNVLGTVVDGAGHGQHRHARKPAARRGPCPA